MGDERRQAPRFQQYSPVRLHRAGTPQIIETLTKDLGVGGVRCLSPTVVPVSTELTLELILSSGEGPLSVRGRAVWFRTIPDSEQFDIGISFIELSQQNQRRLSGYLSRFSRQFVPA